MERREGEGERKRASFQRSSLQMHAECREEGTVSVSFCHLCSCVFWLPGGES